MSTMPFYLVIIIFLLAAIVTWSAGIILTKTISTIDTRFKIGDALGGLILLGIAGSLPEIAVTYSAAHEGHIPVIIGNLLGGIAIQTLVIVIFDFANKKKNPISYLAGSIMLSIESWFAIIITALAVAATFIPASKSIVNINPLSIAIFLFWVVGLYFVDKIHNDKKINAVAADANPGRNHKERRKEENHPFYVGKSNFYVILIFVIASLATLIAGFLLEESGTFIADKLNIGSGIFAATAIALVCSLPEISTGLESIMIGDNHLAVSDIMGGNAFMIVIFLFADIVAHQPVLSFAQGSDIFLGILGILMMVVYAFSFLAKLQKRYFRLGIDSIAVLLLYIIGAICLVRFF